MQNIISKSGYRLSMLSLVLFALCSILRSRAEREVIASGTCRDFSPLFYTPRLNFQRNNKWVIDRDNCQICNNVDDTRSWLITKFINTTNFEMVHVDITVSFAKCPTCKNQLLKVFALQEELFSSNNDVIRRKLNNMRKLYLLKEIKNKTTFANTKETHRVQFVSNASGVTIILRTDGACLIVHKIEVSSFVCNDTTIGVSLPRTVSPAYGIRTVSPNCYNNTVPSTKPVFGLCSSDGEWKFVTACVCKEGFTLGNKGCRGCPINTYKNHVGNDPCSPCPPNSKSAGHQAVCECMEGFYRYTGDNYMVTCLDLPSPVRNLSVEYASGSLVVLKWREPSYNDKETLKYDVDCYSCFSWKSKECEEIYKYAKFRPEKHNLINATSVTIFNLTQGSKYKFKVYSKNMISKPENVPWKFAEQEYTHNPARISNSKYNNSVFIIPLAIVSSLLLVILLVILIFLFYKKVDSCRAKNDQNENNVSVSVPQLQDSGQAVNIPAEAEATELAVLDQQNSQNVDTYAYPYMELNLRREPELEYQSLVTTSDPVAPHGPEDPYELDYLPVIT